MADKGKKSGGPPPSSAAGPGAAAAAAADAEAKAKLKAERKAFFEATKGAQIAADKAEKNKNKKKGNKQPGQEVKAAVSEPKLTGSKGQSPKQQVDSKGSSTGKPEAAVAAAKPVTSSSDSPVATKQSPSEEKKVTVKGPQKTVSTEKPSAAVKDVTNTMKSLDINEQSSKSGRSTTKPPSSAAKSTAKTRELKSQSRVQTLFDHLPKGVDPLQLFEENKGINTKGIDPAFISLGLMYAHGQLQGSNKRVIALIHVIENFIESYCTPPEKDFKYDIAVSLKRNLEFLRKCRPFAVAMNNTVDFVNGKLSDIEVEEKHTEKEIKEELVEALKIFREERIDKATEAIVAKAKAKIAEDDVVLIFGSSDLVREVIVEASREKTFSIVIIDGRPYATERRSKGLDIINELEPGVQLVKYTSITGLSNVIRSVTKVILSAHALLTNGGVLAHAGTSQIALMASANNIPVIVCCETLKFCDKSPTDSFFLNEIGTGFGLGKKFTDTIGPDCGPYLVTPVIKYDVTPPELVTAVITDVDILPCTSVPVVLRVQENRFIK